MATATLERLVRHLRGTLDQPADDDHALLRRYLDQNDANAFDTLVRRHGPAVLAAARSVLAANADVEDVFQAAFLALLRSGRAVRHRSVGRWLYVVAHRLAVQTQVARSRRAAVERQAVRPAEEPAADLSWREALAILHEELNRLPDRYRLPLLLCYLDGRSREEAAAALGWSDGSVKGRLERGRELLRRRLVKRGVTLSAGLVAAAAGATAGEVPPGLVELTRAAAAGSAKPAVATLAAGVVPALGGRARLLAVALAVAALLGVGLPRRPAPAAPAAPPASAEPAPIVVRGRVVTPDGKPAAGARLFAFRWNSRAGTIQESADAGGRFTLKLSGERPTRGDTTRIFILASAPGVGPEVVHVPDEKAGEPLTVRLAADDVPLTGRILTLEGRPVPGVTVQLKSMRLFAAGDLDRSLAEIRAGKRLNEARTSYGYVAGERWAEQLDQFKPVATDEAGRFRIPGIGRERLVELAISGPTVQHQVIVARTQAGPTVVRPMGRADRESDRLTIYGANFDHLATPTRLVRGTVRVKGTGEPVAGVRITADGTTAGATTDATGRYELSGCPKGATYAVTARPPDERPLFAAVRTVSDTAGLDPLTVDIELLRGVRMTGRVLDGETGKPVPCTVVYHVLEGNSYLNVAPDAMGTQYIPGGRLARGFNVKAAPAGNYSVVVAPGPGLVMAGADFGRYRDAYADPAEFFPGRTIDRSAWGDTETLYTPVAGSRLILPQRGSHEILPVWPGPAFDPVQRDIVLHPAAPLRCRFADPHGKPVSGVWVYGAGDERIGSGVAASADLTVPGLHPRRPRTLFCQHDGQRLVGLFVVNAGDPQPRTLTLEAWATVTGRLVGRDGQPVAGARVLPMIGIVNDGVQTRVMSHTQPENAVSGPDGRFRLPALLPGKPYLLDIVGRRSTSADDSTWVKEPLKPGETRDLGDIRVGVQN